MCWETRELRKYLDVLGEPDKKLGHMCNLQNTLVKKDRNTQNEHMIDQKIPGEERPRLKINCLLLFGLWEASVKIKNSICKVTSSAWGAIYWNIIRYIVFPKITVTKSESYKNIWIWCWTVVKKKKIDIHSFTKIIHQKAFLTEIRYAERRLYTIVTDKELLILYVVICLWW